MNTSPFLDLSGIDPVKCGLFVNGEWMMSDQSFDVVSPSLDRVIARVASADENTAKLAIQAASDAFSTWRKTTAYERSELLKAWHASVLSEIEGLALTISAEMGKPIQESRGEIRYAASFIALYAEEALRNGGGGLSQPDTGKTAFKLASTCRASVCHNTLEFPAAMITRKLAPALAAGCTAIVKPAEQAPLTALYLASLWKKIGGPAGTLQVLTTDQPAEVSKSCSMMPVFES